MKKRILSILLALTMALSLVTPAYAAPDRTMDEGDEGEVDVQFTAWAEESELRVHPGETVTMQVVVTSVDEEEVTYRWCIYDREAGEYVAIPGAAESSLDVSFDDLGDQSGADYSCLVTDYDGVSEETVYFSVYREANEFDAWAEEQGVPVHPGETVSLQVCIASEYPEQVTYEWYRMDPAIDEFVRIPNASGSSLSISFEDVGADGTRYFCRVTDYGGLAQTDVYFDPYREANEFDAWAEEPEIRLYPCQTVTLQVEVTSEFPDQVTYEWFQNDQETGDEISLVDAVGSTLTVSYDELTRWQNQFYCRVTDYGGMSQENVAFFVYRESNGFDISTEENYFSILPGESVTMTVEPGGVELSHVTYQWYRWIPGVDEGGGDDSGAMMNVSGPLGGSVSDGGVQIDEHWELLEGATSSTLTTADVPYVYTTFRVVALDGFDEWDEEYFYVEVDNAFDIHAVDDETWLEMTVGESVTLTVEPEGNDVTGVSYQWFTLQIGEDGSEDWVVVEGAVSDRFTVSYELGTGDFRCTATDRFLNHSSVDFHVTVYNEFQAWAKDGDMGVLPGSSAALEVEVQGIDLNRMTCQWYRYNEELGQDELIRGATGTVYTTDSVTGRLYYSCLVRDGYGNSQWVSFSVYPDNQLSVETVGEDTQYVAPHGNATMAVNATAYDPTGMTFQWKYRRYTEDGWTDFETVEGADGPSLTVADVTEAREYCLSITERYGACADAWFYIYMDNAFTVERQGEEYLYPTPDESVTLAVTVSANDTVGVTYQWYRDVFSVEEDSWSGYERMEEANGSSLTVTAAKEDYYVIVSDRYGNSETIYFYIRVDNQLQVEITNGENVEAVPGASLTLQTSVSGVDLTGITYQWYKNGNRIQDAVSDTYTIDAVTEWAEYWCRVRDSYGSIITAACHVTVDNQFSAQRVGSSDRYVPANGSETLAVTVSARDMEGVTYRWYRDVYDVQMDQWSGYDEVEGADGPSLTVSAAREDYYVTVSDRYGNSRTIYFYVYVDNHLTVTRLGDYSVPVAPRGSAALQVSASADDMEGLTYRWSKSGEGTIEGAVSNTCTVSNITASGWYYCTVTDRYGNTEQESFYVYIENHLTVTRLGDEPVAVAPHGSAALQVSVSADDMEGLTYRWSSSEEGEIEGAVSDTYTLSDVTDSHWYYCTVADRYGNSCEVEFYVYVENHLTVTRLGDESVAVAPGGSVTLQVTASADEMEGLTYRWSNSGEGTMEGVNSDTCTVSNVSCSGWYYCVVTDAYGNDRDVSFYVYVDNQLNAEAVGDTTRYAAPNEDVTLAVTASALDTDGLAYQWYVHRIYHDGDSTWGSYDAVEGANSASFTLHGVTEYTPLYCRVADKYGNSAEVWFYVNIDNHLTVEPVGGEVRSVAPGSSVTLQVSVTADDTTGLTYRWYWYGTLIDGADGDAYTLENVTENASYRCEVTDRFGNECSVWFYVHADNQLTVERVGDYTVSTEANGHVELAVNVSALDLTGITYQWYVQIVADEPDPDWDGWSSDSYHYYHWEEITGANGPTLIIDPVISSGQYTCRVNDRYGNGGEEDFHVYVDNQLYVYSTSGDNSVYVEPHGSATMAVTVSAADLEGVTYQWYEQVRYHYDDGSSWTRYEPVEGATGDSFTINDVTERTSLYCCVTDKYGNTWNEWFYVYIENHLSVESVGGTSRSVEPHGSATMAVTVSAVDSEGLTINWYRQTYTPDQGWSEYELVEGENGTELTAADVTCRMEYYVRVTDKYGNSRTVYFYLSVENNLQLTGGGTRYVTPDEETTLTVTVSATNTQGMTITWYDDNYDVIPDANGTSLYIGKVTGHGRYHCSVTDAYGNESSVYFYVYPASGLVVMPACSQIQSVAYGTPVLLEVAASVQYGELHYQWLDGVGRPIEGAESSSYLVGPVTTMSVYRCRVSDDYGNGRTVNFQLSIPNGFYARIPDDQIFTVSYGGSLTLRVEAGANSGELTYNWLSDTMDGHRIGDGSAFVLENVTHAAYPECIVTDQYGNSECLTFRITLSGFEPYGTQTILEDYGSSVTLTAPAMGPDAGYRWYRSGRYGAWEAVGTTTAQGSAGNTYTIEALTYFSRYRCDVIVDGDITPYYFDVHVNNGISAAAQQSELYVRKGESATLKVVASTDVGELTYRWFNDYYDSDVNTENADGDTFVIPNVNGRNRLYCQVTDQYGNWTDVLFDVYVDNQLTVTPVHVYESRETTILEFFDGPDEFTVTEYVVPVAPGGDADLSVTVSALDMSGVSLEWYYVEKDGYIASDIGYNGADLILPNVQADVKIALVVMDNGVRNRYQFAIEVQQPAQPVIMTQPADFVCDIGETALFAVRALGTGLTYRWQSYSGGKWSNTSFATSRNSVLSLSATEARDGRQFRCVITDAAGHQVISQAAVLHARTPFNIIAQPEDFAGVLTTSATFHVEATGAGLTYMWQTWSGTKWINTSFASSKTDTLTMNITAARDGKQYRCVVTDQYGRQIISEPAVLTAIPAVTITAQPADFTGLRDTVANFHVEAAGGGLTYQWQSYSGGKWINNNFASSKTDTLSVMITEARDGAQYRCVVTDAAGNQAISEAATLRVEHQKAAITGQPEDFTGPLNGTATFTVAATGEGLTYQWQSYSGGKWINNNFASSKTDTLSVKITTARNGAQYRCVVTDQYGNEAISEAATLHVAITLAITGQPEDFTGQIGETATFTVEATGEGLTYQWQYQKAGSTTWNNSTSAAAKTAVMTIGITAARDGQQYRCIVTDKNGNQMISETATLHVAITLAITGQPEDFTGALNEFAAFTVAAVGEGLTYQWQSYSGGKWINNNFASSKTDTLSVKITTARNGAQYRCMVTDQYGNEAISNPATLHVQPTLAITGQPEDFTGQIGETATFTVEATGEGLTYQWQYQKAGSTTWNNSTSAAAKTAVMTIGITAARDGQQYRCIVTDKNGNQMISETATLHVAITLAITGQPEDFTGALNEFAAFTVAATGEGLTYQWQSYSGGKWINNNFASSKTDTLSVKITTARNGAQYRCVVTDQYGNEAISETATLHVG